MSASFGRAPSAPLTLEKIQVLSGLLDVPADVLIRRYPVAGAGPSGSRRTKSRGAA